MHCLLKAKESHSEEEISKAQKLGIDTKLRAIHPITNEPMNFNKDLPKKFKRLFPDVSL